jgi:hypothetical protein
VSLQTTNQSLDELAKGLATGTLSRGKAIRWMGGALLGAALASFPGVAWANDCRRLGRECRRDSQCCSKNCIRRGDDKVCACPEGKSRCGDRCVNLDRNERHCGSCGNRCDQGEECVNGECTPPPCPPELQNCCECLYRNTTTGNFVSRCESPSDIDACSQSCTGSVPEGTEYFTSNFHLATEGEVAMCAPTTGAITGTVCDFTECTPPPP